MDDTDRMELKLSDAFEQPEGQETHGFEWTATMVNINHGRNRALMEKCRILEEYSIFTGRVKEYSKTRELRDAIDKAVEECIVQGVLKDVLEKHRREVVDMCLTEFDEKKYEKIVWEEGLEKGLEEGRLSGLADLVRKGILDENIAVREAGIPRQEFEKWLYRKDGLFSEKSVP